MTETAEETVISMIWASFWAQLAAKDWL